MKFLKIIVPFFVALILLTVLFGEGTVKDAGMFFGVVGFIILLAILINYYRRKRHIE